jgi:hypothetical protein
VHTEYVTSGWVVDFGTGVAVDWMPYDSYRQDDVPGRADTVMIRGARVDRLDDLGITVLGTMHISERTCAHGKWAGMLAIGINIKNDADARLYLGAGRMLGREHKFSMNLGVCLAPTPVLDKHLELDREYARKELEEGIMEKRLRPGVFFAMSYALTSRDKQ